MYPSYYIICVKSYEIDGREFQRGEIDWKPKGCRPITSGLWRKATDEEINEWVKRTGNVDIRALPKL